MGGGHSGVANPAAAGRPELADGIRRPVPLPPFDTPLSAAILDGTREFDPRDNAYR